MRPERHNKVNVLLFFDIGGWMDDHIKLRQEMFSAANSLLNKLNAIVIDRIHQELGSLQR